MSLTNNKKDDPQWHWASNHQSLCDGTLVSVKSGQTASFPRSGILIVRAIRRVIKLVR